VIKQIVFCADGTWNGPGAEPADDIDGASQTDADIRDGVTNVVKLFANLAGQVTAETQALRNEAEKVLKSADGAPVQVAKYLHGVGDSRHAVVKALGGVLGAGVIGRIVRGYTFISRNYDPGDSIHIVGFSRGAYTARALAGMIANVGLLDRTRYDPADATESYLRGVAAWMRCKGVVFTGDHRLSSWLNRAASFAQRLAARFGLHAHDFVSGVRIASVGVWDTVGSMGIPQYVHGERRDLFSFVDRKLSPLVDHGFHAMALDERRADFPVTRWEADPRAEEVWFVGAHSDVGGGYPASESALSDIALEWMTGKLAGVGVQLASPPTYAPNRTVRATGFHEPWKKPPFNLNPRARSPVFATDVFHPSVAEYWQANGSYRTSWPKGFGGR
jgi:uncharacterized protein (DUF2235 family)